MRILLTDWWATWEEEKCEARVMVCCCQLEINRKGTESILSRQPESVGKWNPILKNVICIQFVGTSCCINQGIQEFFTSICLRPEGWPLSLGASINQRMSEAPSTWQCQDLVFLQRSYSSFFKFQVPLGEELHFANLRPWIAWPAGAARLAFFPGTCIGKAFWLQRLSKEPWPIGAGWTRRGI